MTGGAIPVPRNISPWQIGGTEAHVPYYVALFSVCSRRGCAPAQVKGGRKKVRTGAGEVTKLGEVQIVRNWMVDRYAESMSHAYSMAGFPHATQTVGGSGGVRIRKNDDSWDCRGKNGPFG